MSSTRSGRKKKPLKIRRGNVTVMIYEGVNSVGNKTYPQFTVTYYLGKDRKRRRFADLDEAKREAELVATKLANAEQEVLKLSPLDRAIYVQALANISSLDVPLNTATEEYANARERLPDAVSLSEVVSFYLRRHPAHMPQKTVSEVYDELIALKRSSGKSEVYLKDLSVRLGQFASSFQMPIAEVTGKMIEDYVNQLDVGGKTKRNHLRLVTTLIRFAVRRRYLTKDALEELEMVEKPEVDSKPIEVFTPAELAEMFEHIRPELIPWLAIAAFAGLRTAELSRLKWENVNFEEAVIDVPAKDAKTKSRRLTPISENLMKWLAPYRGRTGAVVPFDKISNQIERLTSDICKTRIANKVDKRFVWKHNGLRHSCISYRLAITKNVESLAYESGNSPNIIFKSYRKVVTEGEAGNWFAITPESASNVIQLDRDSAPNQVSAVAT